MVTNYGPRQIVENIASEIYAISSEAVTIPAGAAGSIVTAQLKCRPVLNAQGGALGGAGNTSLALTSLVFTTEVSAKDDADLANGEFWVDYLHGTIRGKKATTGTTATATYSVLRLLSKVEEQNYLGGEDRFNDVIATVRKKLATSTYSSPLVIRSAALEASHLIKASAGNLDAYRIEIAPGAGTATYYLQFFNSATLPPEGAVPDLVTPITVSHTTGTVSTKEKDFGDNPIYFSLGCYLVVSSTQYTKTIAGAVMSAMVQAS